MSKRIKNKRLLADKKQLNSRWVKIRNLFYQQIYYSKLIWNNSYYYYVGGIPTILTSSVPVDFYRSIIQIYICALLSKYPVLLL